MAIPAQRIVVMVGLVLGLFPAPQAASSESPDLPRFTFTEYHMGIDARIILHARDEAHARKAAEAAYNRIAELEQIMSDYRPSSELMQLCAKAGQGPVPVSRELFEVLERAQRLSAQTDGAFDVTVGPLVQLWRIARREAKLPTETAIAEAKSKSGWQKITLDRRARTVALKVPGMRLDLGGIAKGYAADAALRELRRNGVKSALIELGGDIVLGDAPPNQKGWSLEVPNSPAGKMVLRNCAISSSGDTEQFVLIGGVRYSHVVDPRTGYGLTTRVQASVIAPNGFMSDPLSTALTLLPDLQSRRSLLAPYGGTRGYTKTVRPSNR